MNPKVRSSRIRFPDVRRRTKTINGHSMYTFRPNSVGKSNGRNDDANSKCENSQRAPGQTATP